MPRQKWAITKKNGVWYLEKMYQGKWVRRRFRTKQEAEQALKQFLQETDRGLYRAKNYTLKEIVEGYEAFHRTQVKDSSYKTDHYEYTRILKNCQDYEVTTLQNFINQCDEMLSQNQVKKIYCCLDKAFKWAVKERMIQSNPMAHVHKKTRANERKHEMNYFTYEHMIL